MTYGEMAQFLIQDGDQIKIDPNRYDELLTTLEKEKKNPSGAEFVRSIGKNDDRRVLDLALTGMGITSVTQLQNNPDMKFNETAGEAIIRLREVSVFMEQHGYNKLNAETQKLVDEYISTGKPTLEELDRRKDVFYKFIEVQDQTGLETRIAELAGNDIQKKQDLLLAINTFRENMPNGERRIDLQGNRPDIRFVTYGQSTPINLENKTLTGFTPTRFDSYFELFKAANLTNTIQDICKDKISQKPEPFYIGAGGDITFDNAKLLSKDFDTRIITGGRGGSLKDISPKLETYKEKYAIYLNGLRNRRVVQPPVTPEIPRWR